MVSRDELAKPLADAITPSAAEIAQATEVVIAALASGPADTSALEGAVASALGVVGGMGQTYNAGDLSSPLVDAQAAPLAWRRARAAARLALAKLAATGVVTPSGQHRYTDVEVFTGNQMFSTTGPIRIPTAEVELGYAYQLTPGSDAATALPLTSLDAWLSEAAPLVTERTRGTLQEALSAAQRGLYQAALTLLGAVCESAWYLVGEAFRTLTSDDLGRALDAEQTGQVQRLVRDQLATVRRQASIAGELYAHASYLRDVRNYGIHAGGDETESLEHAFTESATAVVILQTQRHLVRLLTAARAAGATLP